MKAVVYTEFGPPEVLRVADVSTPTTKVDEVLVHVHATSVAYGDLLARNFKRVSGREFNMPLPLLLPSRMHLGFRRLKVNILGSEFSGEVEAAGRPLGPGLLPAQIDLDALHAAGPAQSLYRA
jgi:NADPH:quinone reductase-like Zn-dependent oxidoreductase